PRRHVCFASIVDGDVATPVVVDEYDLDALRKAAQQLNVALHVRTRCARLSVSQRGADPALPSIASVVAALADDGIGLIHLAAGPDTFSILVDERDAVRAQAVLVRCAILTQTNAA